MINLSKDSVALNNALTAIIVTLYQALHGKKPKDSLMSFLKQSDYSSTVHYNEILDQYEIHLELQHTKGNE